jgi:hypothetical protein
MIKSISVTLSSEGGIIPGIVPLVTSGGPGETDSEEMNTLSPPKQEIAAGAELLIHHIFIIISYHYEKIAIFFYPPFLDCLQGFISPLSILMHQGISTIWRERVGTVNIIPDAVHPIYLQGGALSIKVQP